MLVNFQYKTNTYPINYNDSTSNMISFSGKAKAARDLFTIRTPREGLIKQNSFLHPRLKLIGRTGQKRVVATGRINAGEIVCIFVGYILTGRQVKRLPKALQCKTLQLAPDIFQLASKNPKNKRAFDAAEHFNHSCDPNLFLTGNNVLVAKRNIEPGEELCYDYGTSDTQGNPDTLAGWKCECGSANCRGGNNPDAYKTIIKNLTQEYGPKRALDMVAHYIKMLYQGNV